MPGNGAAADIYRLEKMRKFRKIVAIEPVNLCDAAKMELHRYADEVVLHEDLPTDDACIVARIGDADAVLLSFTSSLSRAVLEQCPAVEYVGMCCSLYSPESANVDIRCAGERGITVTGVRDYGDEGVIEYVVSELVRRLHGFGCEPWNGQPSEITGVRVGVVGLGRSGGMIADAMKFFGAEVCYFARSEKADAARKGYRFLPLRELLGWSDVVFCCLNKNTVLLHQAEFEALGQHKLLFNTGLSPAWDEAPFREWLEGDNHCYCDTLGALGDAALLQHGHVHCMETSSGCTSQAYVRLGRKVLDNMERYLSGH